MSLPIVTTDSGQQWDCQACGICCRGSIVPLSSDDLQRLELQRWDEHPDFVGQSITSPHGGGKRLAHREDGSCVFLQPDGLCRIHAEHGYETKPTPCRMFPLQLAPQRTTTLLTLRCACPTASQNIGQPLEAYLPAVKRLVQRGELRSEPIQPPCLKRGEWHDWDVAEPVLNAVRQQLTDDRFPIVRRIAHTLQLAERIESAATAEMTPEQWRGQLEKWDPECIESASRFFQQRDRPGAAVRVLFRLAALEHVRLLPSYVARESWGERLRLVRAACRIAWGAGRAPDLGCSLPPVALADLEQPRGATPIDVLEPMTRMFETTSRSYLYATAHRGGWSIVESVRALSLMLPIGMWLLRWLAHGRDATIDDVATVVVALDRGHGHAILSGAQHRWRVSTLQQLGGLERLAAWYVQ